MCLHIGLEHPFGFQSQWFINFWLNSESTLYPLFDLSTGLGSEGRRKESFYTLFYLCHWMCVCCKGVCTTAAPLEVIQYMLQLNSVSSFPEESKAIWRKGLRSWHVTGSGCLTLTTFTCVYVTSADKRICSFWSALHVSKKQCCVSGRLFAHPQLIPGAGESCSAEKAHVLILHSVHECRDEVQLLMLMQKMALISASPAVVLKYFPLLWLFALQPKAHVGIYTDAPSL